MKAAIYARYSSENQKESSIDDQRRNCAKRADAEGWQITTEFHDSAISGSTSDRPGYLDMLKAGERQEFSVLLIDDLSRLSRDSLESEKTIRRLEYWGIRIIGISDGYDSESRARKIHRGIKGLMNEVFLDDLRDRTHRGQTGQALKGLHAGGRAYGYRHVPVRDQSQIDHLEEPLVIGVRREIDPAEAEIVREIFEKYASGYSPRKIANELKQRCVPSPGSKWRRSLKRRHGWRTAAIQGSRTRGLGILNNEIYRGIYISHIMRRNRAKRGGNLCNHMI